MKLLIVGGVAGGASAAVRARRLSEDAEIILFERSGYISWATCGSPYYLGSTIPERKRLFVQSPGHMRQRFNIDVRVRHEVLAIDCTHKELTVKNLEKGTLYKESYDKLILSPGAVPVKPPLPGIDSERIYTLRSLEDVDAIKEALESKTVERVVVVGAGLIGLELAENLKEHGVEVALVEMLDQVLPPIDREMAAIILQHLKEHELDVYLKNAVAKFEKTETGLLVHLGDGTCLEADMVLLSIGIAPEVTLAREAGLTLGERKGITVDEYLQTNDADIFAIGDAIEVKDYIFGRPTLIPLAGPANKQGRIAADTIFGRKTAYRGTQGTAICKVFDLSVGFTGCNEKVLTKEGISYLKAYIHPLNHASYYPGATPMSVKLLFSPQAGKILGAQMVGSDGVDKRIDILATALRAGLTVADLETLELAYAPPYSSAKDPINLLGYVSNNILKGDMPVFYADDLKDSPSGFLLDVRTAKERHGEGYIKGSYHIPIDEVRERISEIPRDKEIFIYCATGYRSYIVQRMLIQKGYRCKNLVGGYKTYRGYYL